MLRSASLQLRASSSLVASSSAAAVRASAAPRTVAAFKVAPIASGARFYKSSSNPNAAAASPQKANAPSGFDKFAETNNAYYIEEMHRRWKQDPSSVHASWDVYFSGLDKGIPSESAYRPPPTLMPLPQDAPPIDADSLSAGESVDDHLKVSVCFRRSLSSLRAH